MYVVLLYIILNNNCFETLYNIHITLIQIPFFKSVLLFFFLSSLIIFIIILFNYVYNCQIISEEKIK